MRLASRQLSVRLASATPADLPFIDRLRRRDSKALGFLSLQALAQKIQSNTVRVAWVDERRAGFLLHGSLRRPEVRVFQLAVDPEFRGLGLGRRLVADLRRISKKAGAMGVSLRCREALRANKFWCDAGFELHNLEPARKGSLFVWVSCVRRLSSKTKVDADTTDGSGSFRFHSRWHPCPACGRMTCDTWSAGGVRRKTCSSCLSAPTTLVASAIKSTDHA